MATTRRVPLPPVFAVLGFLLPRVDLGDQIYIALRFFRMHKRLPQLRRPETFNDHLLQIKISDEILDPMRQMVSDKHLVKNYIASAVGSQYALETYALLSSDSDVDDFEPKTTPCVIKPTHASQNVIFLRSPEDHLDRARMKDWLRMNYYTWGRERNYKHLRKRVIVEEFFSDDGKSVPNDFKVFCFRGEPKMIQVDQARFENHVRNLYTTDWREIPVRYNHARGEIIPRPKLLDEMLEVARKAAAPFSFIRVDFFEAQGRLKIGELTNCPDAAHGRFTPRGFDKALGRLFEDDVLDVLELTLL